MINTKHLTLKEKAFINELPKTGFNQAESMRRAGYTRASSRAGKQYQSLRKLTQDYIPLSEDEIKAEFEKIKNLALANKDFSNANRALEALARIRAMFTDKSQVENKNPDKIIISYVDKSVDKPVDNLPKDNPLPDKDLQQANLT